MRFVPFSRIAACLCSGLLIQSAVAQGNLAGGGRPPSGAVATTQASQALGRIAPSLIYRSASFATGGVGLRNRGDGAMGVSGVVRPVRAAFLYWAVITAGTPNATASNVYLRRLPSGGYANIAGVPIGTGPTPCWSGDRVTVYRGAVPLSVASGNGFYHIVLRNGANGRVDGEDPWVSSPLPLFEGASIVIVGSGTATVGVYDRGLAGKTFYPSLSYSLNLPVSAAGRSQFLFHNIGADGQVGTSVQPTGSTPHEVSSIGSVRIAGPGSRVNVSDWNGTVAGPLPQLWDDTRHDITVEARQAGVSTILPIGISAPEDCLVPVANVVSIR